MLNTNLIKIVSDLEELIQDWKSGMIDESEFKLDLLTLVRSVENNFMDEKIEADLAAGKKVMGRMRNPITGKDEEMLQTEFICQKCGKKWLWGTGHNGDTFYCPRCSKRTDRLVPRDDELTRAETEDRQIEELRAEAKAE